MSKNIRIDDLPESAQRRILAIRETAKAKIKAKESRNGVILHLVTPKQLDRARKAIEAISLGNRKGWEQTNSAMALGRVMLRYFEENPMARSNAKKFVERLQANGTRVMHRKGTEADQAIA